MHHQSEKTERSTSISKVYIPINSRKRDITKGFKNKSVDLIVDAIIGYSLHDPPQGMALEFIQQINGLSVPILSLDVPSCIDSTSGSTPGE